MELLPEKAQIACLADEGEDAETTIALVPGMRILGVHDTGLLESARLEEVVVGLREVELTWISGRDARRLVRLPICRIREYAAHRVGTYAEPEHSDEETASDSDLSCLDELRTTSPMQVPDSESKRELVPRMIQMIDTAPLTDDAFVPLPEKNDLYTVAGLHESTETDTRPFGVLTSNQKGPRETDAGASSSSFFLGIHPDEDRARVAQQNVDSPIAKAALAQIFHSLIGEEDSSLLR